MKSRRVGLVAMAAAGVLFGAAAGHAAEAGGDEGRSEAMSSGAAMAAAYRGQFADEPGVLLALGGGGGGGGSGGGGGGSGGGGGGSGGGGSGGGGGGGGGSGGGDGDGDGGSSADGSGGPDGGTEGDAADAGPDSARTDSLGLTALGLNYSPTPLDLTVVRWRGPMSISAMPSPDARVAALSPEVRDQVTARMGPGQRTSEVVDTTLLNQTAREYAGASAYWSAPDVNAVIVEQQGVLRPVQVDPTTLRPVTPPAAGG